MRKFIKLNDIQANKIAGKYEGTALDPRFIEVDFNIIPLSRDLLTVFGIAKRYLIRLKNQGKIKIIDMSVASDRDVVKIKKVFRETMEEGQVRIVKRVTKWDYTKIDINEEL